MTDVATISTWGMTTLGGLGWIGGHLLRATVGFNISMGVVFGFACS